MAHVFSSRLPLRLRPGFRPRLPPRRPPCTFCKKRLQHSARQGAQKPVLFLQIVAIFSCILSGGYRRVKMAALRTARIWHDDRPRHSMWPGHGTRAKRVAWLGHGTRVKRSTKPRPVPEPNTTPGQGATLFEMSPGRFCYRPRCSTTSATHVRASAMAETTRDEPLRASPAA